MSIDPINAARIKASGRGARAAAAKVSESQQLLKELKNALEETQDMSHEKATGFHSYIGESWATCAQRKADYERRAMKLQKMYDKSMKDESYSNLNAGWIILKARKMAMTLSAAEKRGCEWVAGGQVDTLSTTNHMLNQTKQFVPCHGAAKKFAESKKHDPDQMKVANNIIQILLSTDCKPNDVAEKVDTNLNNAEAEEEEEEAEVQRSADKLKKLADSAGAEGSLLESYHQVAEKSNWAIVIHVGPIWAALSASVYFVFLFFAFVGNCMLQVALPIFLLMYIFCLLMTFIQSLYTDLSDEQAGRQDSQTTLEDRVQALENEDSQTTLEDRVQALENGDRGGKGGKGGHDPSLDFEKEERREIKTGFQIVAHCGRKMVKVVQLGAPLILFGCAAAQALAPIMPAVQANALAAAKAVGHAVGATAGAVGGAVKGTARGVGHVAYAVGSAFVYVGKALISVLPSVRIIW